MRETTRTKLEYLAETKSLIKSVVIEKGQTVADEDDFRSYVDKIKAISGSSVLPLGYTLKEVLPETELTFAVGNSDHMPNTPTVILADATAVANGDIDYINDGESGLVIWDGVLYAVYAGLRHTSKVEFPAVTTSLSAFGSVGNISIPSAWQVGDTVGTVVADTKGCGASSEPFFIVANSTYGFQVAIPEDSTELTHTLQMFKFVKTLNET